MLLFLERDVRGEDCAMTMDRLAKTYSKARTVGEAQVTTGLLQPKSRQRIWELREWVRLVRWRNKATRRATTTAEKGEVRVRIAAPRCTAPSSVEKWSANSTYYLGT